MSWRLIAFGRSLLLLCAVEFCIGSCIVADVFGLLVGWLCWLVGRLWFRLVLVIRMVELLRCGIIVWVLLVLVVGLLILRRLIDP